MDLTPDIILRAYAAGVFPMAESRDDPELFWVDPDMRGLLPLDQFHVSRSLKKVVRRGVFEIRYDTAFQSVVLACAESNAGRDNTWINDKIVTHYCALHQMGYAHSVECWRNERLVGGLYGLSLGGAFFGESMFSKETDASKVALVYLVTRLLVGGYRLLDTQFVTNHLKQFGAIEISRRNYHGLLEDALSHKGNFYRDISDEEEEGVLSGVLQSRTQTS
ncbi:MAG: leucyl/phenylalanyl-tRNA--protein transferase [Rhodospirillales bacterium]|nr:leucyl/phenylalanyl-tRNA--protein transferase [Rhodospirillales bacterium]